MSRERLFLLLAFGLVLFAVAGTAEAQNCSISVPSSVAFGTYDVYGTFVDTTGTIRIGCILATNVTVDLSRGNAPSFAPRTMLNGVQQLNYNLYLDAARTTIWGDNTGGSSHFSVGIIFIRNVDIPIYGRIPAGLDVVAGTYNDAIIATINF